MNHNLYYAKSKEYYTYKCAKKISSWKTSIDLLFPALPLLNISLLLNDIIKLDEEGKWEHYTLIKLTLSFRRVRSLQDQKN
jgi:hypothetical protein